MYKLKIISSTVRPGRKGPIVAKWIASLLADQSDFEVELIDLGELNLPLMNEPNHPAMRKYTHDYTKAWSETIDGADAFIIVTGEYNYNYPAPLRNALDYLFHEWAYKPAGVVSYGGISGGTRANNALKNDLATLKVVALQEAVNIPFFTTFINEQNEFVPSDSAKRAAANMLKELLRWTKGLKAIKENTL
jgi:NAD(P)H-dependent FMN reductase